MFQTIMNCHAFSEESKQYVLTHYTQYILLMYLFSNSEFHNSGWGNKQLPWRNIFMYYSQRDSIQCSVFLKIARFLLYVHTKFNYYNTSCVGWFTMTIADQKWCVSWTKKCKLDIKRYSQWVSYGVLVMLLNSLCNRVTTINFQCWQRAAFFLRIKVIVILSRLITLGCWVLGYHILCVIL